MSLDHSEPVDPTSTKVEERRTAYPGGLLFPESEIQALAAELPQSCLPVLTVVLDALSEQETVGLDATAISLISHLAEDYGEQAYRRLMSSVVRAIEEGAVGILAASQTIRRVVEILESAQPPQKTALGEPETQHARSVRSQGKLLENSQIKGGDGR